MSKGVEDGMDFGYSAKAGISLFNDPWHQHNVTWADLENLKNAKAKFNHWCYLLALTLITLGIKALLEKVVFRQLGLSLGLSVSPSPTNKWREVGLPPAEADVSSAPMLTKSQLDKFCECGFRCCLYFGLFTMGLVVLQPKEWSSNMILCFIDYPFGQVVEDDTWWYFTVQMAASWCQLFSLLFIETRQKDYLFMMAHHLVSVSLLQLSWATNTMRMGSLIIFFHDCTDIALEIAKMCKYAGFSKASKVFVVLDVIGWLCCRVFYYPSVQLQFLTVQAMQFVEHSYFFGMILFLLATVLIFNLIWVYLMFKAIYVASMKTGMEVEDSISMISSSEDTSSDEWNSNNEDEIREDRNQR